MCFLSIHYRGTVAHPGLVCGLMPHANADCEGLAYRVAGDAAEAVVAYLDGRELVSGIYLPTTLPVILEDGQRVFARTYVADTAHPQFAGDWNDARKAAAILSAAGSEGRAYDYMRDLMAHLDGLGVADSRLAELWVQVEALKASSPDASL